MCLSISGHTEIIYLPTGCCRCADITCCFKACVGGLFLNIHHQFGGGLTTVFTCQNLACLFGVGGMFFSGSKDDCYTSRWNQSLVRSDVTAISAGALEVLASEQLLKSVILTFHCGHGTHFTQLCGQRSRVHQVSITFFKSETVTSSMLKILFAT